MNTSQSDILLSLQGGTKGERAEPDQTAEEVRAELLKILKEEGEFNLEDYLRHYIPEGEGHRTVHGYPNRLWTALIAEACSMLHREGKIVGEQYNWGDLDITIELGKPHPESEDFFAEIAEFQREYCQNDRGAS